MMLLEGKAGIITGGGSGIGQAAAVLFAKHGAKLVIADWKEEGLQETVELVSAAGGEIYSYQCDVSKEQEVKAMVEFAVEKLGGLNFAFNNAGITPPHEAAGKLPHEIPDGVVEYVMQVNAFGVYYAMKYELPYMIENGGGNIVNTGSVNSTRVGHFNLPYSASKHALYAMTKAAAIDCAPYNVRVNALGPGITNTPMIANAMKSAAEKLNALVNAIPDQKMGQPEEMAQTALYLLSDMSTHVVGQIIMVDGGEEVLE